MFVNNQVCYNRVSLYLFCLGSLGDVRKQREFVASIKTLNLKFRQWTEEVTTENAIGKIIFNSMDITFSTYRTYLRIS